MMGRKIVFASGKGGVGKSTIAANIAVAAAQLEKDVLLLDADVPMADLALSLGLDVDGPTLHEVLAGEAEFEEAIYSGPEDVKIVPSGISLDGIRKAKPQRLEDVINDLTGLAELIIVDAPSGLGSGALTSLRMSDELVVVTDPVITSLSDALRTKEVAERFGTEVVGVVVSRTTDPELDIPNDEIESMLGLSVLGVIPEDSEVRESTSVGEPVVARNPNSPSGKAFRELASKLFAGEIDYQDLVEKSVSDIKEFVKENDVDFEKLLETEKENKNRKTLKEWLKSKTEKSEE